MTKIYKGGVLLVVIGIVAWAAIFLRTPQSPRSYTKDASPEEPLSAQFKRLEGRWLRPDGGYTLVIEDVKPDGTLKASYFNPAKINVHTANWRFEGDRLNLFVELRDINYPGSKYNLLYVSEHDVLSGTYFQAVYKQTYEVHFIRTGDNLNK